MSSTKSLSLLLNFIEKIFSSLLTNISYNEEKKLDFLLDCIIKKREMKRREECQVNFHQGKI